MLGLAVVGCVLLVVALGDSDPVAVAESEVDGADALDAAAAPPQQPPTAAAVRLLGQDVGMFHPSLGLNHPIMKKEETVSLLAILGYSF